MLPALYFSPELHNAFYERDRICAFSGTEMRLYFYLVRVWADWSGNEPLYLTQDGVSADLYESRNILKKATRRLYESGLIQFEQDGNDMMYRLNFAPSVTTEEGLQ